MALAKQVVSLGLVGGLNEKEDVLLTSRPREATNCRYAKTGAVSKRPGYECIGPHNARLGGAPMAAPELLASYNSELLRIGGGKLDTYEDFDTSEWIYRGRVSECVVRKESIVAAGSEPSEYSNANLAYASGYLITVYRTFDGTWYRVFVDVMNPTTGARLLSRYQVTASTTLTSAPTVVANGAYAGVFYQIGTGIYGKFLNLSTLTFGNEAEVSNVSTPAAGLKAYACDSGASDNAWVFVWETTGGDIVCRIITRTISSGTFTATGTITLSGTGSAANIDMFSLRYSAERIWIAYAYNFVVDLDILVTTVATDLSSNTTPFSVHTDADSTPMAMLGIERYNATNAIVAYSFANTEQETKWRPVGTTAVHPSIGVRTLAKATMLSRPLVRDETSALMLVTNAHSTHATQFLIDLHIDTTFPENDSPRIAAVILPRQLGPLTNSTVFPRRGTPSNWVTLASDTYMVASYVAGPTPSSFAIVGLRVLFDSAWARTTATAGNLHLIGGGVLLAYDGSETFEVGFAHEPDAALVTLTDGTGGSMTSSETYGYKFVYAWQDAQGNVHRSTPSANVSITLGASDTKVDIEIPPLNLTNKGAEASNSSIFVEVYRTVGDGTEYFLAGTVRNVCSGGLLDYEDTLADATLANQRRLYTDGGVLERVIPSGGSLVLPWKNGLLMAGTDDDSVWISGEILPGDGPWFNDQLVIDPFEGGRVTAMSTLDDNPILMKAESLWYLQGEPPNDLGSSTIGLPKRIQTDAGCTDVASVVATPQGVGRMARNGLYMLGRDLADRPIGKGVEDSYRPEGFAGAALIPSQSVVRWLQRGSGASNALNLDYYHSEVYGAPVWTKDALYDVEADDVAEPISCAVWNGAFVWISSYGFLYRERVSSYLDSSGETDRWVTMTFETGFAKAAGPSALQRVWRVYVTGENQSPHGLEVTISTDRDTQSREWTPTEIADLENADNQRLSIHVADQKSTNLKVKVEDTEPAPEALGTGFGLLIRDISLEIGVKPTSKFLPARHRK